MVVLINMEETFINQLSDETLYTQLNFRFAHVMEQSWSLKKKKKKNA